MEPAKHHEKVGKYAPIASLGQGGMANIYLALMAGPARFNKLVVLKILREDAEASREDLIAMFLDEARLAARMQHRNIVQTYEIGEIDGRYYMTMEYLEGQTLRAVQRSQQPGGFPLAEELRVLAETARGLHYAHGLEGFDGDALHVVHRDVSPQNVFLTYDGQIKLLDFGIAKTETAEHLTQVGVVKGKIDYIAPEQVRGERVDRRADVFSLGAMLYEAVSGKRFGGGGKISEVTKMHARVTGGEPRLRELKPDAPEVLLHAVERAIALNPADRLESAEQFADILESYLSTLPNKPSEKSLASQLAAQFQEHRVKMRQLIDQAIQSSDGQERSLSRLIVSGALYTESGVLDLSAPGSGVSMPIQQPSTGTAPRAPAGRRRKQLIGVGASVAAAGMVALLSAAKLSPSGPVAAGATMHGSGTPSDPTLAAAGTADQNAPRAVAEQTISLRMSVVPAQAVVTLDGATLPNLPFSGHFRRSGAIHILEARAEGYHPLRQLLTFEEDREINLVLVSSPPPSRNRAKPTPVANSAGAQAVTGTVSPAAPRDEEDLSPGVELKTTPKKPRGFDMEDPYAK